MKSGDHFNHQDIRRYTIKWASIVLFLANYVSKAVTGFIYHIKPNLFQSSLALSPPTNTSPPHAHRLSEWYAREDVSRDKGFPRKSSQLLLKREKLVGAKVRYWQWSSIHRPEAQQAGRKMGVNNGLSRPAHQHIISYKLGIAAHDTLFHWKTEAHGAKHGIMYRQVSTLPYQ